MIVYKCPSCGADIDPLQTILAITYKCEHCGTAFSFYDEKDIKKIAVKIKQIKIELSNSNYEEAEKLCNRALNIEPECAEVYFLKLMCKHFINSKERFSSYKMLDVRRTIYGVSLEDEYINACRFGDEILRKKLEEFNSSVIYNGGVDWEENGFYTSAFNMFKNIAGFKDSDERAAECKALSDQYGNTIGEQRKKERIDRIRNGYHNANIEPDEILVQEDSVPVISSDDVSYRKKDRLGKQKEKSKIVLALWILGWVCMFPVPAMILICKKTKLPPFVRRSIIGALWIIYLIVCLFVIGPLELDI